MHYFHAIGGLRRLALGGLLWAALTAVAASAPLRLTSEEPVFHAAGHLEMLVDAGGSLDAAQARQSDAWTALPGSLSAGFTDAAIWLRLPLDVGFRPPGGWILRLNNALIDDVRLYGERDGAWTLLGTGGENVPRDRWSVGYRSPAFLFLPQHEGPQTLLVRLQSKNALATQAEIWQRLDFDNVTRREGLFFGLYFGFYLLLICVHAVFWLATRAPLSGLFLAYLGGCVFNEAMSLGLIQQITNLPVWLSDRLLGVSIACSLVIASLMTLRQLALETVYPRLDRALAITVAVIAAGCALLIVVGRYAAGILPVQWAALLLILVFSALAVHLLMRGHRPARAFLLIFGVFYLGVLLSFLRNLGILPVNAWTEHASALGTMLHMVLLGSAIIGGHERARRARERQQANLVAELAMQDNQRLEQKVTRRTAALRDEIRRREVLEEELRAALQLERRVREEQRDFVAMVSHEFRTPLAVIGTSAQQLGNNLDAPAEKNLQRCQNIRDAAKRLLTLVDDYLTDHRMGETQVEPLLQACDPHALIERLRLEFPAERLACAPAPRIEGLVSDASLLHIALRNLLSNADRHAPPATAIDVTLRTEGGRVLFDVAHPGAPISPQEQDHLFQKYFRGRNAQHRPGAGLGLYLVRTIARKLGGDVELTGCGGQAPICFRLSVPLTAQGGSPPSPAAPD